MIKIPDKPPCDNIPDDIPDEMLIRMLRCGLNEERQNDEERYLSCNDCPIYKTHGASVSCDEIMLYLVSKRFAELREQYDEGFDEGYREGYSHGLGDCE